MVKWSIRVAMDSPGEGWEKVYEGEVKIMGYGDDFDDFDGFGNFGNDDFDDGYGDSFKERYDRANGSPLGSFDINDDGDLSGTERLARADFYYNLEEDEQNQRGYGQQDYLLDEDDEDHTDNNPYCKNGKMDFAAVYFGDDKNSGYQGTDEMLKTQYRDIYNIINERIIRDKALDEQLKELVEWCFKYMDNNFQGMHFSVFNLKNDAALSEYREEVFKFSNILECQCQEFLEKAKENSENFRCSEAKRQMYAAMVVIKLIGADQKTYEKSRFIMEKYNEILAARYLSPVDGFLYLQAVTDHFISGGKTVMEDLDSIYTPGQIICERAKTDPENSLVIWRWLIKEFSEYLQYGSEKDSHESLTVDVVKALEDSDLLRDVAKVIATNIEAWEDIFKNSKIDREEPAVAELYRLVDVYEYAERHGGNQVKDVYFNWNIDKGMEMADHVQSYQTNEKKMEWRKKKGSKNFDWTIK